MVVSVQQFIYMRLCVPKSGWISLFQLFSVLLPIYGTVSISLNMSLAIVMLCTMATTCRTNIRMKCDQIWTESAIELPLAHSSTSKQRNNIFSSIFHSLCLFNCYSIEQHAPIAKPKYELNAHFKLLDALICNIETILACMRILTKTHTHTHTHLACPQQSMRGKETKRKNFPAYKL